MNCKNNLYIQLFRRVQSVCSWCPSPGLTVFDSGHKKPDKRKKVKGGDAEEIDNFLGPWAKYVDEKSVAKPTEVKEKWEIIVPSRQR